MKYLVRFVTLLGMAVAMTAAANAEAPGYVTGLEAEYIDGVIEVEWDSQPEEDIAYYRVYYSVESILDNDGLYDDYEETEGPDTSYTLEDVPDVDMLYIAVIAVGIDEEDINLFVEEVEVDLTERDLMDGFPDEDFMDDAMNFDDEFMQEGDGTSGDMMDDGMNFDEGFEDTVMDFEEDFPQESGFSDIDPMEQEQEEEEFVEIRDETFVLPKSDDTAMTGDDFLMEEDVPEELPDTVYIVSVEPLSPTEVAVELSTTVMVDDEKAPDAFTIMDAFGNPLAISSMTIEGKNLTISTEPQEADRVYEFRMNEPAYNEDGIPLDPIDRKAFFDGHPDGLMGEPDSVMDEPLTALNVDNMSLDARVGASGLYTVTARWVVSGDVSTLSHYLVSQTRDSGKTYGTPQVVQASVSGIEIQGVLPGLLGLKVVPVTQDGEELNALVDAIAVGGSSVTASVGTQMAVISGQAPVSSTLPGSGPGMTAMGLMLTGGVLGWMRMRRKIIV